MRSELYGKILLTFAIVCGSVLFYPFADIVPGLNGDEAWAGLEGAHIIGGLWPYQGMNNYTGPFHQYLVAICFKILGFGVGTLRFASATCNLLSIVVGFILMRRFFGILCAGIFAALLASMPFTTIAARMASEVTAFNVLFALTATLWLSSQRWVFRIMGGFLLGIGTLNHLLFFPFALMLLIAGILVRYPLRNWIPATTAFGLAILILGWKRFFADTALPSSVASTAIQGVGKRLHEWPPLFSSILHGDILFMRMTGEIAVPTPPMIAGLILVGIVFTATFPFLRLKWELKNRDTLRVFTIGFLILFVATLSLAPGNSDRYFNLPMAMSLVFPAYWLAHFAERFDKMRPLIFSAVISAVTLQAARTGYNLIYTHLESGGKNASFKMGTTTETSNHFIRTDELYIFLRDQGIRKIYTEFHILFPILFYDIPYKQIQADYLSNLYELNSDSRVVVYNGGLTRNARTDYPQLAVKAGEEFDKFFILSDEIVLKNEEP